MKQLPPQPVDIYRIEGNSYVIRTGDKVTIIRFT